MKYSGINSLLSFPELIIFIVSLISAIIMFLLLMNEYFNYKAYNIVTLMYVDKNRGSDKLPVYLDIDFYNLPCELLSMEIRNNLGLNVQNIEGNLTKYYLNSKNIKNNAKELVANTNKIFKSHMVYKV